MKTPKLYRSINESKQILELRKLIRNVVNESLTNTLNEQGYHPATPKNIESILDYMNSPSFKNFNDFIQNGHKSRTYGLEFNPRGNSDAIKQIFDGYRGNTEAYIQLDYLNASSMPKEIKDLNNKYLTLSIAGHKNAISLVLSNITANISGIDEFNNLVLNSISMVSPDEAVSFRAVQELYVNKVSFKGSNLSQNWDLAFNGNKVTAINVNCSGKLHINAGSEINLNSIKTKDLSLVVNNFSAIKAVSFKNVSISGTLRIYDTIVEKIQGAPKLTGNEATDNAQLKKFFKVNNVDLVLTDRTSLKTTSINKDIKWKLPEDMDDMWYEYETEDEGYSFSAEVTGTDLTGNNYTGTYNGFLKSSDQDLDDRDFWSNIKFGPNQWKQIEDIEEVS